MFLADLAHESFNRHHAGNRRFLFRDRTGRFGAPRRRGAIGERRALILGLACGALGFAGFGLAPTGTLFWLAIPLINLWRLATPSAQGLMSPLVAPSDLLAGLVLAAGIALAWRVAPVGGGKQLTPAA
jgi:hypothetical protein